MNKAIYVFLIATLICIQGFCQGRSGTSSNRLGIGAKYVLAQLNTDNFNTASGSGFAAGFTTRGAFYNDFDIVFGIDFIQANLDVVAGRAGTNSYATVKYAISGAQVNILASYLIAGDNFSIEAGPIFMLNSKMALKDDAEAGYIVEGYTTLQAGDIQEISRFNLNGYIGLTAGIPNLRATLGYQYGLLNVLDRLNKENLELKDPTATNFKGNLGLITAGIVFYL